MLFKRVILGVIMVAASAFKLTAQEKVRLDVSASYTINGNGDLRCYVSNKQVPKGSKLSVRVYAQNNVRNIPMQLQYNSGAVPIKLLPTAKNSNEYLAFRVLLKDVLYIQKSPSNYSWTWRGRAKAPASPIVAVEKVSNIRWWVICTIDKKEYTSDTLTTYIKP